MDRDDVRRWVDRYEEVWRAPGTDGVAALFTDDATYLPSPWAEPVRGLAAIQEYWDRERDDAGESFTMTSEVLAVDGATAVARIEVVYADGPDRWRDLWVVRFDRAGRCRAFEEWPFAPGQPDGHGGDG